MAAKKKPTAKKRPAAKKAAPVSAQPTTFSPETLTLLVALFAALSILFFAVACMRYA